MAKVKSKEVAVRRQLSQLPVAGNRTSRMLPKSSTSQLANLDGVHTIRPARASLQRTWQFVPVLSSDRKPLMPTTPWRAERWIKSGKATPFWSKGVFCVRLNQTAGTDVQPIACGIDPGSKMEGYTVKSEAHTFLNIQAKAVTWVKDTVEVRRMMRQARRQRKTPYRTPRANRAHSCGSLAPSTKARWQWKLRVSRWLLKIYPIECFVVEDIKASTHKGGRRWNRSFSPLEVGKKWFYEQLGELSRVELLQGWDTKQLRDSAGLKKTGHKLETVFTSHCVDSWVLANDFTGGHIVPENTALLLIAPIQLHRRQLHALQPAKNGIRRPYGGTRSLGFKRGSLVKHVKYGFTYVGGTGKERISLHSIKNGKRLAQNIKSTDCKFLTFNPWRTAIPLPAKTGSLLAVK